MWKWFDSTYSLVYSTKVLYYLFTIYIMIYSRREKSYEKENYFNFKFNLMFGNRL